MAPVNSLLIEESFIERKVDKMEKSDRKNLSTSIENDTLRMPKGENLESFELKSPNTESTKMDSDEDKFPQSPKDRKHKYKNINPGFFSIPEIHNEGSDDSYDEQEESPSIRTSSSSSSSPSSSSTSGRLFPRESTTLEQILEKALAKSTIGSSSCFSSDETLDFDKEPTALPTLAPLPRGSLTMQRVFEEVISLHSSPNEEGKAETTKSNQSSKSLSPPFCDRRSSKDEETTVTPSMYFMDSKPISVQPIATTSRKISWADEKGLALTSQSQSRPKNSSTNNSMSTSSLAL